MRKGVFSSLLLVTSTLFVYAPGEGNPQVVKQAPREMVPMTPCKYESTDATQIRKTLYMLDGSGVIDKWRRYDYARIISGLGLPYTVSKIAIESPQCRGQRVAGDPVDFLKAFTLTRELSADDPLGANAFEAIRLEFDYSSKRGGLNFLLFQEITRGLERTR